MDPPPPRQRDYPPARQWDTYEDDYLSPANFGREERDVWYEDGARASGLRHFGPRNSGYPPYAAGIYGHIASPVGDPFTSSPLRVEPSSSRLAALRGYGFNYYERPPDVEVKLGETATAGIDIVKPRKKHHGPMSHSPDEKIIAHRRLSPARHRGDLRAAFESRGRPGAYFGPMIPAEERLDSHEFPGRKPVPREENEKSKQEPKEESRGRDGDDIVEVVEEQSSTGSSSRTRSEYKGYRDRSRRHSRSTSSNYSFYRHWDSDDDTEFSLGFSIQPEKESITDSTTELGKKPEDPASDQNPWFQSSSQTFFVAVSGLVNTREGAPGSDTYARLVGGLEVTEAYGAFPLGVR